MQKIKNKNTIMWITIVIHITNGCGEQSFPPHLLALYLIVF